MTTAKTFELKSILSLLNKEAYLDVKKEDMREIVEFVHGPVDNESELSKAIDDVIDYIADRYPRLVAAASIALEAGSYFNQGRYNSLINLFRQNHEIEPMQS